MNDKVAAYDALMGALEDIARKKYPNVYWRVVPTDIGLVGKQRACSAEVRATAEVNRDFLRATVTISHSQIENALANGIGKWWDEIQEAAVRLLDEKVRDALHRSRVLDDDDEEPTPACPKCGMSYETVRPGDYQPTCNCNEENDPLALYNALRSSVQQLASQVAVLQKNIAPQKDTGDVSRTVYAVCDGAGIDSLWASEELARQRWDELEGEQWYVKSLCVLNSSGGVPQEHGIFLLRGHRNE